MSERDWTLCGLALSEDAHIREMLETQHSFQEQGGNLDSLAWLSALARVGGWKGAKEGTPNEV